MKHYFFTSLVLIGCLNVVACGKSKVPGKPADNTQTGQDTQGDNVNGDQQTPCVQGQVIINGQCATNSEGCQEGFVFIEGKGGCTAIESLCGEDFIYNADKEQCEEKPVVCNEGEQKIANKCIAKCAEFYTPTSASECDLQGKGLIQFVNASAAPEFETVDIYIDEELRIDNLPYQQAQLIIFNSSDSNRALQIAPGSSLINKNSFVKEVKFSLPANQSQIAIIAGVDNKTGSYLPTEQTPHSNSINVFFYDPHPSVNANEFRYGLFNGITDPNRLAMHLNGGNEWIGGGFGTYTASVNLPYNEADTRSVSVSEDLLYTIDTTPYVGKGFFVVSTGFYKYQPDAGNGPNPRKPQIVLFEDTTYGPLTVVDFE